MKIGQKVVANTQIREDDWFKCEWDEDHEPYQIDEGTEGVITEVGKPYEGFYTVNFGDIHGVVVACEDEAEWSEIMPLESSNSSTVKHGFYKLPCDIEISSMKISERIPAGTIVKVVHIIADDLLEVETNKYGCFQVHIDDLIQREEGYPGDDASPEPPHADYWTEG